MKIKLVMAAALAIASSAHADWEIIEKVNTGGEIKRSILKIKGDKIRKELGSEMTLLIDAKTGATDIYRHAEKIKLHMDTPMGQIEGAPAKAPGANRDPFQKAKATGEMVKVGEWQTEVYTIDSAVGKLRFYVAKEFPKFADLNLILDKVAGAQGLSMMIFLRK